MPVRFLVVDDHDVVRMGLRHMFACRNDWEICGEAADGEKALTKLSELSPDVVILDLSMPGMNGFETAIEMRRISPFTRIILFSMHEIPVSARAAGADAFVSKVAGVRDLLAAIERVVGPSAQGHPPLPLPATH